MLVGKGSVRRSLVTWEVKTTVDSTAEVFAGKENLNFQLESFSDAFLYSIPNVVIQEDQSLQISITEITSGKENSMGSTDDMKRTWRTEDTYQSLASYDLHHFNLFQTDMAIG